MSAWSFYDTTTGMLCSFVVSLPELSDAQKTAPTGCAPIPGHHDHLCQRVDVSVEPPPDPDPIPPEWVRPPWYPPVISYTPPAPDDTEDRVHEWNDDTKRWRSKPTLAWLRKDCKATMQLAINEQLFAQADSLRNVVLALAKGNAAPANPLATLKAIDAEIAFCRNKIDKIMLCESRAKLDAVMACTTQAQLDGVTVP